MSSSTRRRPDRRVRTAAALAVVAVAGALGLAGRAGAAPALEVLAVQPADGEVTLVAGVTPVPAAALPASAFEVTDAEGARLTASATPVLSGDLATALVLDTSDAGAGALQAGINGAAGFLLQLPDGARTLVVTDGGPPTVLAPLTAGASGAIAAVNAVRPGGERSTGAALQVALAGLPAVRGRPRVLLLHTGGTDAGGESAAALAARLRAAGVLLAVVATGPDQGYWQQVADGTGGALVSARGSGSTNAFDRLATTLRGRYAVTVARPAVLPATLRLTVRPGGGTASAPVTVRAEPAPVAAPPVAPPAAPVTPAGGRGWWWLVLVAVGVVAGALLLGWRRRAVAVPGLAAPPFPAGAPAPYRPAAPPESAPVELPRPRPALDDNWPFPAPAVNGERAAVDDDWPFPRAAAPLPAPGGSPLPRRTPGASSPPVASADSSAAAADAAAPGAAARAAGVTAPASGTGDAAGAAPAAGTPEAGSTAAAPDPAGSADPASGGGPGTVPDPGVDERAYQRLDAEIGRAAADVTRGRLDTAHAVAKIAFAARGRLDLLDRVIETERRLTGADLGGSPSPAAVLTLLIAARRIVAGEVALVGPSGVRVEQRTRVGPDGRPRHVLRLTGRDRLVRECRTAGELARHVDLATLTPDA